MEISWFITSVVVAILIIVLSIWKHRQKEEYFAIKDTATLLLAAFLGLTLSKTFESDSSTNLEYHEPKFKVSHYNLGTDSSIFHIAFKVENIALLEAKNLQYITVHNNDVLFMSHDLQKDLRQGSEVTLWSVVHRDKDIIGGPYSVILYLMYEIKSGKEKRSYFQQFNFYSPETIPKMYEIYPARISYSEEIESYDSLYNKVLRNHNPFYREEGTVIGGLYLSKIKDNHKIIPILRGNKKLFYYNPIDSMFCFFYFIEKDSVLLRDQIIGDKDYHSATVKWGKDYAKISTDGKEFYSDSLVRKEIERSH